MNQQNWRIERDSTDYFGHQKKQMAVENRRPVIRKASDLVGPGISATATRIADFNNVLAVFNGFFSADVGALNGPNDTDAFVGFVSSDAELGGVQQFTSLVDGTIWQRMFTRNPADASAIYFAAWKSLTPV
jgi:hypothetical protein